MLINDFFDQDAIELSKALLGKVIKVKYQDIWLASQIVETEAYYQAEKASHASLGFTEKRKALFMAPGTIYMYYSRAGASMNVSARGAGNAVLIKAGIPYINKNTSPEMISLMQQLNPSKNSSVPRPTHKLCAGQTLLCKSLNLHIKEWDQKTFDSEKFYIADINYRPEKIIQTVRLGISPGRDEHLPYRFIDFHYAHACTQNPLTKRSWHKNQKYLVLDTL